jgi:Uma2 family endonuclease
MSGGSVAHNLIATSLLSEIHQQLKGRPCVAFNSDMRVWVGEAEHFAYPDVSALCGDIQYLDEKMDIITNPSFIAEVLSPSTEAYDLSGKFRRYSLLHSFSEYLTLSHFEMSAELRQRQGDGSWRRVVHPRGGDRRSW